MLVEEGDLGLGIKNTARVVPTAQVLGTLELFNGILGRLKLRCSHSAGLRFGLWFGFGNGHTLGFGVLDGHGLFDGFGFRLKNTLEAAEDTGELEDSEHVQPEADEVAEIESVDVDVPEPMDAQPEFAEPAAPM